MKLITTITAALLLTANTLSHAMENKITVKQVSLSGTTGVNMGTVSFENSRYGLLIKPHLSGLTPGLHGFHVHINPSCADNGSAAGGHLDPAHTNKHLGPFNPNGHLGDLPALYVANDGTATQTMIAPRLQLSDLQNHSIMIHAGGDNYSDEPAKLGGGGSRFACGVVR